MKSARSAPYRRLLARSDLAAFPSDRALARWRPAPDLIVALAVALIAAVAVEFDAPSPIRVVLGLALILLLPGYALVACLFPSRHVLDGPERAALSFGLSLSMIPIVALLLDWSRWSLARTPMVVSLVGITAAGALVGSLLRLRLAPADRYAIELGRPRLPRWSRFDRGTRIAIALFALAFVLLAVGATTVLIDRHNGDPLTEFSLLNASGEARFYEREAPIGQPIAVELDVANHLGKTTSYVIAVTGAGAAIDPLAPFTVADGESERLTVRFAIVETGDNMPVTFELWRVDDGGRVDERPHRTLTLMVTSADDPLAGAHGAGALRRVTA